MAQEEDGSVQVVGKLKHNSICASGIHVHPPLAQNEREHAHACLLLMQVRIPACARSLATSTAWFQMAQGLEVGFGLGVGDP